ncbi:polysaccharide biosynthesis protein [Robertkochia marina]|uniref:Polysaccharide biosynthesis protein n=1 Tax=Robertkochia marina TaxID=1227945 RepID=A0A4S3LYY3_9FLAO|nr:nucleoside-diphosphate sugar epimerase/dehydratase [Robertkochia marina]THD66802.1 polysaccharide biosynthesis protein [Robertkochia marina]TRZ41907.1 polysaccharide biosynthesis protein [Robertkochia marina]
MINNYLSLHLPKYASKWMVLVMDTTLVLLTFFIVYFLRFDFSLNFDFKSLIIQLPVVGVIAVASFLMTGSYKGIIRYTGLRDLFKVTLATGCITLLTVGVVLINKGFNLVDNFTIPKYIIITHAFMNFVALAATRLTFKLAYKYVMSDLRLTERIVIYGAGDAGIMTYNALTNSLKQNIRVIAFIDDNMSKVGSSINGAPIMSRKSFNENFVSRYGISEVIIAIPDTSDSSLRKSINDIVELVPKVRIIPPVDEWINGQISLNQIKQVRLEDLLERSPIVIENPNLIDDFRGKTIIVTGAAGSIGSELSRQLLHFNIDKLICLDIAESALYNLQQEFKRAGRNNFKAIVCDVRDNHGINAILAHYRPDVIFHAAAYKHVPLMEENPYEAVKINVAGTRILANAAVKYKVDKFVLVSTDKAVNPTNVMGATKRVAEIFISALQRESHSTKFVTTRFGNVLGSNGSVIPLFRKQLELGGPLTVTHRDVTRYFMTIPEASQLVLQAGSMAKGGEIFLFDMGECVKIFDLAKNMIKLSGLKYPEDIDIEITGLRPGEKLYEELLANGEDTLPTFHEKILISKTKELDYHKLKAKIEALCILNLYNDKNMIVRKLKQIVPEYISNNSDFVRLDKDSDEKSANYTILQSLNFNPYKGM